MQLVLRQRLQLWFALLQSGGKSENDKSLPLEEDTHKCHTIGGPSRWHCYARLWSWWRNSSSRQQSRTWKGKSLNSMLGNAMVGELKQERRQWRRVQGKRDSRGPLATSRVRAKMKEAEGEYSLIDISLRHIWPFLCPLFYRQWGTWRNSNSNSKNIIIM